MPTSSRETKAEACSPTSAVEYQASPLKEQLVGSEKQKGKHHQFPDGSSAFLFPLAGLAVSPTCVAKAL